jgi:UDP-N-acetylglucosamine 2-epimerase (non-hydrolysing)
VPAGGSPPSNRPFGLTGERDTMGTILIDAIVGTRPNMMKIAPLARAISADGGFHLRLIHTGQHYDEQMSAVFFRELGLPAPSFNLRVGPGHHGAQTARILESYERILLMEERPRGVIVVGDVTSTLACALAAAKLNIPVAHVEAGLRSGDRSMPEEMNRIVTDALSDLLFVSDPEGLINLAREGHGREKIHLVGNVMIDTLFNELSHALKSTILDDLGVRFKEYAYLTLHRPSNVDDPAVLRRLMGVFGELCRDLPFVFSVHPRTRARLEAASIPLPPADRFRLIEPLSYRQNLRMIQGAKAVLTDSGGIQEETAVLDVPCLTLRDSTERPITIELGSSELIGNSPESVQEAWQRLTAGRWKRASQIPSWDGRTAERIVSRLRSAWGDDIVAEDNLRRRHETVSSTPVGSYGS